MIFRSKEGATPTPIQEMDKLEGFGWGGLEEYVEGDETLERHYREARDMSERDAAARRVHEELEREALEVARRSDVISKAVAEKDPSAELRDDGFYHMDVDGVSMVKYDDTRLPRHQQFLDNAERRLANIGLVADWKLLGGRDVEEEDLVGYMRDVVLADSGLEGEELDKAVRAEINKYFDVKELPDGRLKVDIIGDLSKSEVHTVVRGVMRTRHLRAKEEIGDFIGMLKEGDVPEKVLGRLMELPEDIDRTLKFIEQGAESANEWVQSHLSSTDIK